MGLCNSADVESHKLNPPLSLHQTTELLLGPKAALAGHPAGQAEKELRKNMVIHEREKSLPEIIQTASPVNALNAKTWFNPVLAT
jgi:hypothetical protein